MPVDVLGGTAIKPVERHGMEAVKWFLYDKEKGAIMGRTPKSWALITLFYIIYYTCLAAFWALMLIIFFQTIDDNEPRWIAGDSLIGTSPAMGVRPAQTDAKIDSSMIIFHSDMVKDSKDGKKLGWEGWYNRTKDFLDVYRNHTQYAIDCNKKEREGKEYCSYNRINCNANTKLEGDQFCSFDVDRELDKCAVGKSGYDKAKPCIFLKLNKIFDLEHDYYNTTDKFPGYVPTSVKERMGKATDKNQVWVDCHGEHPADIEAMGNYEYFPKSASFHGKYFPYRNQPGYQAPLIAVQFKDPTPGQLIHIECRAYAGNIGYDKRDRIGRAHFELLIHNPKQ